MLIHIVLFEVKPGAADADVEKLITEARGKLTQIPGVVNLKAGWVTFPDAPYRVALSMEVPGKEGLEVYRNHPIHKDYVENVILPVEKSRTVIDFEA
jgi:fructose-bisphosphate aldolase class II